MRLDLWVLAQRGSRRFHTAWDAPPTGGSLLSRHMNTCDAIARVLHHRTTQRVHAASPWLQMDALRYDHGL